MKRADLTEKILDIKREKGWTWKYICGEIGGMSPFMITGACLGQMKLTKPQAAKAAELFGLSKAEQALLNEVPMRGAGVPMPPTDPLIYRFYELVMVNGPDAKLAEIVDNPLPKDRARVDFHRHPLYYAVRNHIIDFLVTRSKSFAHEGRAHDPRAVPVVRPGIIENPSPPDASARVA